MASQSAINLYTSVVHNATPSTSNAINLFSSVVHDGPQVSGTVLNITGTVDVSASFDGTALNTNPGDADFRWTWKSVPPGSSITNAGAPLPDNASTSSLNMSGNVGLWHFEDIGTLFRKDTSGQSINFQVNGVSAGTPYIGVSSADFNGSSYFDYNGGDAVPGSTNGITIAFWQFGRTTASNTMIYGINASSDRVINIHLPFSGQVYWDCGNGGSFFYDRINTPVATSAYKDQWNHWVFWKDVSAGIMRIYLNGQVFLEGAGKTKTLDTITRLYVGSDNSQSLFYDGLMDELAIWNRPLSEREISNIYYFQSGSMATDLVGNKGFGETFTFVPDVSGTFTTELTLFPFEYISGSVDAVISSAGPTPPGPSPIISGSNPTVDLVEAGDTGYVLNTYSINLLSVQRSRTSQQVPFKLGTKGIQSLRLRTNTEFTGSS